MGVDGAVHRYGRKAMNVFVLQDVVQEVRDEVERDPHLQDRASDDREACIRGSREVYEEGKEEYVVRVEQMELSEGWETCSAWLEE